MLKKIIQISKEVYLHMGGLNFDEKDFQLAFGYELDKSKNYYVYCRSGGRSAQACAVMTQMCGFENAYNLLGGFMNWEGEVAQ